MIAATARVMSLILRRDRSTLALTFLLPPLIFVLFASVLKDTANRVPAVDVAVFDGARSEASRRVVAGIATGDDLRTVDDGGELRARVAAGDADGGVEIRSSGAAGALRFGILAPPDSDLAAQIVASRLAVLVAEPGNRPPNAAGDAPGAPREAPGEPNLFERETVEATGGDDAVANQVGAVAAMFLLLAAIQFAAVLVEERDSGIYDRVAGTGDVADLVLGKFLFGVAAGSVQAGLIAATAAAVFGTDVLVAPFALLVTCGLTAAVAIGLALAVASLCSTRHQAQTISTFAVLAMSAVGGSMVPLSLLPDWLESASLATPNAWTIAAFAAALGASGQTAWPLVPWAVMVGVSALALALAVAAYRREPMF